MPQAAASPAFFYDELGSQLFNAITLLDEYQVTRDELEIFTAHHQSIAETLPNDCCLIDLGAGVILPFLTEIGSRVHAAMANRCFGVIPPKAMFGRS
jgi:hypothetical protein